MAKAITLSFKWNFIRFDMYLYYVIVSNSVIKGNSFKNEIVMFLTFTLCENSFVV